jgi:hypothetical protein
MSMSKSSRTHLAVSCAALFSVAIPMSSHCQVPGFSETSVIVLGLRQWMNQDSTYVHDLVLPVHQRVGLEYYREVEWHIELRRLPDWGKELEFQIGISKLTSGSVNLTYARPIEASIALQAEALRRVSPHATPREIANSVKMRRDTVQADSTTRVFAHIALLDEIRLCPHMPENITLHGGTYEIYSSNAGGELYSILWGDHTDKAGNGFVHWMEELKRLLDDGLKEH